MRRAHAHSPAQVSTDDSAHSGIMMGPRERQPEPNFHARQRLRLEEASRLSLPARSALRHHRRHCHGPSRSVGGAESNKLKFALPSGPGPLSGTDAGRHCGLSEATGAAPGATPGPVCTPGGPRPGLPAFESGSTHRRGCGPTRGGPGSLCAPGLCRRGTALRLRLPPALRPRLSGFALARRNQAANYARTPASGLG